MNIPAALRGRIAQAAAGGVLAMAAVFIGPMEGRRLIAYLDPVGIPTICDGWTQGVKLGDVATPEECDEKTMIALRQAESVFNYWVPPHVRASVEPATTAAFLSFIYNVGPGGPGVKDGFVWLKAGRHSTMLNLLRSGHVAAACDQLLLWTTANGKRLQGLVKRRAMERELCLSGIHPKPTPIPLERPGRGA